MTSSQSNDEFDDELLSAYVDGELTPAERAAVEARLGSDAGARKLVEELRELSGALRAMPRQRLPRDLRAGVLAETEAADDEHVGPVSIPIDRWEGYRRGMAWSALAIAATLMLTFMQPEQDREGDLATAKRDEAEASHSEKRVQRGLAAAPEMRAAPKGDADAGARQADREGKSLTELAAEPVDAPSAAQAAAEVKSNELARDTPAAEESPAEPASGVAIARRETSPSDETADKLLAAEATPKVFGRDAIEDAAAPADAKDDKYAAAMPVVELQDIDGRGMDRLTQLLAENEIELSEDPPPAETIATAATRDVAKEKAESDAVDAEGEAVLVEGPAMQMANLLEKCRAETEAFAEITPESRDANRRSDQSLLAVEGQIGGLRDQAAAAKPSSAATPGAGEGARGGLAGGYGGEAAQTFGRRGGVGSVDASRSRRSSSHRDDVGRARRLSAGEYREVLAAMTAADESGSRAIRFEAQGASAGRNREAPLARTAEPQSPALQKSADAKFEDSGEAAVDRVQVLFLLRRAGP